MITNRYRINEPIKVVFYTRVSTQHEEQLNALDNQIMWAESILRDHPNWEKVDIYCDRGITGTSAKKRPEFMRMINDASKGGINLVVTRECSRFARNTVDSLEYTRKLASMGVEVFFYNDNIWSLETDGELRLTIMSAMSQEESRHISERVLAGQKTSREKRVLYGTGNILGYDLKKGLSSEDNTYVINEEQAETVRRIFELYLEGNGAKKIANILMKEHRSTASGLYRWTVSNVIRTVKNRTYTGVKSYGKSITVDYLGHNRKQINDESKHNYVEGDFPAIIDKETFEKAQIIRKSKIMRDGSRGKIPKKDRWTKKLRCECGSTFKKYKWRTNKNGEECIGYTCYNVASNRRKSYYIQHGLPTEGRCDISSICEWKLDFCLQTILKNLWKNPSSTIDSVIQKIEDNYEEEKGQFNIDYESKQREKERLQTRINNLLDLRLDNAVDKETYENKRNELLSKMERVDEYLMKNNRETLIPTNVADSIVNKLEHIRHELERVCCLDNYKVEECLIDSIVERIVPNEQGVMKWYLKGSKDKAEDEFDEDDYLLYKSMHLNYDDANKFRKKYNKYLRKNQWKDIVIEVYIEIEND